MTASSHDEENVNITKSFTAISLECKTKEAPILIRWMIEDTLNGRQDPSPVSMIRMKRTSEGTEMRLLFSIKQDMDDCFKKRLDAYNAKKKKVSHT